MCNRSSRLRRFLPSPALISEQIAIKHQTLSFTTFSSSTVIQFLVPRFRSDHSAEWTKLEKRKPDYNFLHDCHITFSIFFFPPDLSRAINWREGAREMRNKMKKKALERWRTKRQSMLCGIKNVHYWSAKRKWNSTTEHKKIFLDFFFLQFSPSPSLFSLPRHPSHSAASAIQPEITLFWISLWRAQKISKKSDCPHTIRSEREEGEKNAKPSFRMWICGCLVEGDVITISIRTLFLLSFLFSFFLSFVFGVDIDCASCAQPFPPPLASQNFFTSWWSSLLLAFAPWSRG